MTDATELDEAAIRARWTRPKREDYQGPGADIAHSMAVLQWSLSRGKEAVTDVPLLLTALDEARSQVERLHFDLDREARARQAAEAKVEQWRERMWATVNERAVWRHDLGDHAGELPFMPCPSCERDVHAARAEAAEGAVAAVRTLADDLSAEIDALRDDLPPKGPGRVAHMYRTAGLSEARDRLRTALTTPTTTEGGEDRG